MPIQAISTEKHCGSDKRQSHKMYPSWMWNSGSWAFLYKRQEFHFIYLHCIIIYSNKRRGEAKGGVQYRGHSTHVTTLTLLSGQQAEWWSWTMDHGLRWARLGRNRVYWKHTVHTVKKITKYEQTNDMCNLSELIIYLC